MIMLFAGAVGLVIIGAIIWALIKHPDLPRVERIALSLIGGGLVWGGFNRMTGRGVDLGDLLFLSGVALLLLCFYVRNPKIKIGNP